MHWIELKELEQVEFIKQLSYREGVLIFKDSTTCSISAIAKHALEKDWDESISMTSYYLNILKHRHISDAIAREFQVIHESPQILLIKDGECFHDASHFDINVKEVKEVLDYHGLH